MTHPLRVLLVGYGFASATFHAPLIQAVPGLALAGVVSRDPPKVHADWPGVPVYPHLTQALAQCDASLVVIAATLAYFNLPEAGLLLILAVDHLLDMGRSATNVIGNSVAAAVVAKWENQIEGPEDGVETARA